MGLAYLKEGNAAGPAALRPRYRRRAAAGCQSNAFGATLFLVLAARWRSPLSASLDLLRGASVVSLTVTFIVVIWLLSSVDLQVAIPWVDFVLHKVFPIVVVLDWLVDARRAADAAGRGLVAGVSAGLGHGHAGARCDRRHRDRSDGGLRGKRDAATVYVSARQRAISVFSNPVKAWVDPQRWAGLLAEAGCPFCQIQRLEGCMSS